MSHGEASLIGLMPMPLRPSPALKIKIIGFIVGNRRAVNLLPRPSLKALIVQWPRISQAFSKSETMPKMLPGMGSLHINFESHEARNHTSNLTPFPNH